MNKHVKYTTTSGYDIEIRNVPHLVMEYSAADIPVPQVPEIWNESKKEMMENPNSPEYFEALQKYDADRERAMLDALVSFGVITDEKMPAKRTLTKELKEMDMAVKGTLLDGYDLTSERDLDILWKKYYVLGAAVDMHTLQRHAMVQWEAVSNALKSFRSPEKG